MSAMAAEAPAQASSTDAPFQADVIFVTKSEDNANEFLAYLGAYYKGFVRLESIRNHGDGVSGALVHHYCLPKCTRALISGMYQFVRDVGCFLWIDWVGLPEPIMCAGRASK